MAAIPGNAQPAPQLITQRDINVMAASVEDARSALIDNAGLRHPGEDLNLYLLRIAKPLQDEPQAAYNTRIQRYLALLARSVDATQSCRRLPALHHNDAANRALWERIEHELQLLPARVAHTQTAWQSAHVIQPSIHSKGAAGKVKTTSFESELAQTVSLLIAIDDGLRDARP